MRMLIVGQGKTGRVVTEIARERGHSVQTLEEKENTEAGSLTAPSLASFDVIIDFTTPEAVVKNLRACLANGAKVVVGTTGWYQHLDDMRDLASRKNAGLLYSTNFSFGVQLLYQMAKLLGNQAGGYQFKIEETHHTEKLDSPSGTALTLQKILATTPYGAAATIDAHRVKDAIGTHRVEVSSDNERIVIEHHALSRRSFAYGAVRGAEWLASRTGCYDFQDVFPQILA
ncbi:MAG TPA: dihydrodipicolinate reductase C-terminal domain-containing protein [Acidobacteriaceae bacterium]|jgi:4-hydroxy-tetrahydrodipicolinate reductase|nr:dihydrodipicolinate reductase C-terminal domain-containing protein [Acidobacteriaceae bacterium]